MNSIQMILVGAILAVDTYYVASIARTKTTTARRPTTAFSPSRTPTTTTT